jgi:primosomal protein N' (replication factor Y)
VLIQVVLRDAAPQYDNRYTYRVPRSFQDKICVGQRVVVAFGNADRTVEAIVWALLTPEEEAEQLFKIKNLIEILDPYPVLTDDQMELVEQMRIRYACTYGDAIRCMLPAGVALDLVKYVHLRQKPEEIPVLSRDNRVIDKLSCAAGGCLPLAELLKDGQITDQSVRDLVARGMVEINETIGAGMSPSTVRTVFPVDRAIIAELLEEGGLKYINQIRVLDFLLEYDESPVEDVLHACAVTISTLNTLKKKGLVEFGRQIAPPDPDLPDITREPMLIPTLEQQEAINRITRSTKDEGDPRRIREFLLYGVTGSGKTEVYMQVAAAVLARDKDVILLVPEISLTPQMTHSLVSRFGDKVAILHSRLTPRERFNQWRRIQNGDARIVVGARSAVFAPVRDLGLLIIDEEQESTYQSEIKPRYHAATIARLRVRDRSASLVLGSATPAVETWHRTETGRSICLRLTERPGGAILPKTHLIDMRTELAEGNFSLFSRALKQGLEQTFAAGDQAMIFLNRRGYSGIYLCRSCGETVMCPSCDVRMTLHRQRNANMDQLICHYCGRVEKAPKFCPSCGSDLIAGFGVGTQQVEQAFTELFPDNKALRMDQDTTAGRTSHIDLLSTFRAGKADVLIGTQMIAKGHDFPNVTLVGILSADLLMGQNDFRASERAFQLITQAAGRAGRKSKPGEVYIQAYDLDHYAVRSAAAQDFGSFYRQEIKFREQMGYPPFGVIASVVCSGKSDQDAEHAIQMAAQKARRIIELRPDLGVIRLLRPTPSPIRRVNNQSRWQLVMKSKNHYPLSLMLKELSLLRYPKGVSVSLRLDPA